MHVSVKHTGGMQFVAEPSSGHALLMDAAPEFGGSDSAARPTELLLAGLGGCSGMDVISILKKKKQHVTGLEINVDGQKATEYPKKFAVINIEFVVRGRGVQEQAVKRAVELSMQKYCSVKATIDCAADVRWSYKIEEEGVSD